MDIKIDNILEGKVSRIMPFGAFIDLGEGKSGLVHISEIADAFVKDINDYVSLGQEVLVKIVSIDESGKIALSIKKAVEPKPEPQPQPFSQEKQNSFEDKLARFMKDSNEKLVALKHYHEGKRNR
ncbi:MAG: S1 RNA-binding domain-containing protein [Firmicutes bacterium]|nr:S1 RNA-binding domain-containing protein [Bacillota bacterium]